MKLYVIHESPTDYPGRFVVRRLRVTATRSLVYAKPHAVTTSLAEARASIPLGLFAMPRDPEDPPSIVETWL